MSKKKTYDQKIEEYMEKLKTAQKEKKEFIEKYYFNNLKKYFL